MTGLFYPVVVTQLDEDEGGGYLAQALDLVGCMSRGETPQQALGHVQLAMIEWLKEARRLGRTVPEPNAIVRRAGQARAEASEVIRKQQQLIRAQAAMIDHRRDGIPEDDGRGSARHKASPAGLHARP